MAELNDRCFCWFPAAVLVPLDRAPTWWIHTKLYKFSWNCLPNNAAMKNRTDLNLGDVFCLSIIYHIPDSWLNLLNGYDFYFRCKPPIGTADVDCTGSGKAFLGSGICPKYGAGIGKTINMLTGSGIWLLPGKQDLLGMREIVTIPCHDPNKRPPGSQSR